MPETILIIEDEDDLREWEEFELEWRGYNVLSAANGREGLEKARTEQPDLILLDVQLPHMSGFEVCTELQKSPSTDSIPVIFLTARTQIEDKLNGFNAGGVGYMTKPFKMDELEARIKAILTARARDLERAKSNVKAYKSGISQNLNHELLTPMSMIMGSLDVLEMSLDEGGNPAEMRQLVDMAKKGANRMHWLLHDMLTANELEQDSIIADPAPTDLSSALQMTAMNLGSKYRHKQIELLTKMDGYTTVGISYEHLSDILRHLFDNAYKFSPNEGTVFVSVDELGESKAHIMIRDEGPGVPGGDAESIFEKFYQADMTSTRAAEGMGFGLYLARHLARLYGGDVTIDSGVNAGSTFCLILPLYSSDMKRAVRSDQPALSLS